MGELLDALVLQQDMGRKSKGMVGLTRLPCE